MFYFKNLISGWIEFISVVFITQVTQACSVFDDVLQSRKVMSLRDIDVVITQSDLDCYPISKL